MTQLARTRVLLLQTSGHLPSGPNLAGTFATSVSQRRVPFLRRLLLALITGVAMVGATLVAVPTGSAAARGTTTPSVRLANSVVPAVANGELRPVATPASAANQPLTVTVTLNRTDRSGFNSYLANIENPHSPRRRSFLTPRQLAKRFGPSQGRYDHVRNWLLSEGFTVIKDSIDRLTITVEGSRAQAERAFSIPELPSSLSAPARGTPMWKVLLYRWTLDQPFKMSVGSLM